MNKVRGVLRAAPGALVATGLLALSLGGATAPSLPRVSAPRAGRSPAVLHGPAAAAALAAGGQQASLGAAVRRARYRVEPTGRAAYKAANPAQGLHTAFRKDRVDLTASPREGSLRWRLGLRLAGIGRGQRLQTAPVQAVRARDTRVEYTRRTVDGAAVTEWYENAPEGVEQGFTVAPPPSKDEGGKQKYEKGSSLARHHSLPLTLAVALDGDLRPVVAADGQTVSLRDATGSTVLRGAGLKAWDANGRGLPVRMVSGGNEGERERTAGSLSPSALPFSHSSILSLQVDDAGAVYPVTIDPTYTQVQRLTQPASEVDFLDNFGTSLAVDGDTALVGAAQDDPDLGAGPVTNAGAVYVFTRSAGVWSLQQKLSEPLGDARTSDLFGSAVALDGDTAIVGALGEDLDLGGGFLRDPGAVYVFTRSGGVWSLQQKLTAPDGEISADDVYGWDVELEGDTLVVGVPQEDPDLGAGHLTNAGAAYVYTRTGGSWSLLQRLTEPPGDAAPFDVMGFNAALDGDTLVVSAEYESPDLGAGPINAAGAAYVFVRSGGTWSFSQRLTEPAGDAAEADRFGVSIGLEGDTLLVGASQHSPDLGAGPVLGGGAVYVFTRSGGVWTQQQELTETVGDAADGDEFGLRLALDGDTAVVGAWLDDPDPGAGVIADAGAAYVFTRSGGVWSQQQKLTEPAANAAPLAQFGRAVALDRGTLLVGAPLATVDPGSGPVTFVGAVYYFANNQPPVAQGDKTLAVAKNTVTALGITAPTDPDNDPLAITVNTVPNPALGVVRKAGGGAVLAVNDSLTPAELAGLVFHPVVDQTGAAGTFSYTVSDGNGGTASQTITIQISNITLTAPPTGTTRQYLTAQWTAPPGQSTVDWVGFYRADVPGPEGYLAWTWTGGTTSGTFAAYPPTPGTYVFRYYLNNGTTLAAVSNLITVTDQPAAQFQVTLSPATVAPGETFTLSWSAPAGRPATDWIGFYATGTPGPSGYLTWFYVGGSPTGSKTLAAPSTPGTYVARYYLQDGSTVATTSNTLTVTASAPSFSVTPSSTSLATGGTLTVNWTAPGGRPAHDWVALVRADQVQAGPPQVVTGYTKWAYTGGTTSGSTQFSLAGVAPGTYYCVYLLNDTMTVGAQSVAITVTP